VVNSFRMELVSNGLEPLTSTTVPAGSATTTPISRAVEPSRARRTSVRGAEPAATVVRGRFSR